MKKWAIAAVVYLLIVIASYATYDSFFNKAVKHGEASSHETSEKVSGHDETSGGHGHEGGDKKSGDVKAEFVYNDGKITINLNDPNGKPVDELEVNHEKLLHLIVVDEHLDQYYHLHPVRVGAGKFEVSHGLKDGVYKAFIDIKPSKLNYEVTPLAFSVGGQQESQSHADLKADEAFVKTIDGKTVEMDVSSFKAGEPITLNFKLDKTTLEPYLGAAGHVVILNEEADQYLHVHPVNEEEPIFETKFDQAGKYKIWAEFKQNGKVRVFSYVIEVK